MINFAFLNIFAAICFGFGTFLLLTMIAAALDGVGNWREIGVFIIVILAIFAGGATIQALVFSQFIRTYVKAT